MFLNDLHSNLVKGSVAAAILFIASTSLSLADSTAGKAEPRLMPSGLNSEFRFRGLTFDNYLKLARKMIRDARVDLHDANRESVVEANAPFSLLPSPECPKGQDKNFRRGVLLIHGLTDSPYVMRPLGTFLQQHCYRVMAVLLPGHGTRPGDLLEVKWQEWAAAVNYGVAALHAEVEHVYLAGFSAGGALSVYQALRDPRVKGLVLFAPALEVSWLAMFANWHEIYSWKFEKAKWRRIAPDLDPFKYESFPKNAAYQIRLLTLELDRLLGAAKVRIPVFVAASLEDATVHTDATIAFFRKVDSPRKKMVLYSAEPDRAPKGEGIQIVESKNAAARIRSSAHTALLIPATDPHYGANGTHANCLHYLEEKELFERCRSTDEYDLGEITSENLKAGILRRLTYNPHYETLVREVVGFLDGL